jgi:hypothetical protein
LNDAPTDLGARFLQGVGLAECPLAIAEQRLIGYHRESAAQWRLVNTTNTAAEALSFLSTLTWPPTRHVVFANGATSSAFINNSRNGSDYADEVFHLPRHLNCRFARVLCCPNRVWRQGKIREVQQYEARIFDLHDAKGETIRSILCMNDGGRWVYHTAGTPHPIEAQFSESSTRVSARFLPDQLAALAAAFGLPLPTQAQFRGAGQYVLFGQNSEHVFDTCTIAEADDPAYGYFRRGMGYVDHMDTHAASVVADFERCLAINPDYEPRVREYLREARRRLT